jgi:DNA-binding CsgD family transcriptional regulator
MLLGRERKRIGGERLRAKVRLKSASARPVKAEVDFLPTSTTRNPFRHGWIDRYGLSEAEADVLVRAAEGQSRTQMASARGCSELTIKKHVSTMLRLLSDRSLQAAVARLLREMAGG